MSYTLKSNAINSAATFFFVAENDLTDLTASITVTAVGTASTTGTVGGKTEYAYASAANNYLSATIGAIATGTPFCVLFVGRPSASANDTDYYAALPGSSYLGTTFSPARMRSELQPLGGVSGPALTGYTHPTSVQHIWIYGRESDNAIRHGFDAAPVQVAAPSTNSGNISTSSGVWKFGGTPTASGLSGFGVGIFAVFVGVAPSEVWNYISDTGNNGGASGPDRAYSALLQAPATGYTINIDAGTYSLTGQDVALSYTPVVGSYSLNLEAGEYLITGADAYADYAMAILAGTYSITGQEVTFEVGGPLSYSLNLEAGSYNITGIDVRLRYSGEPVVTTTRSLKRGLGFIGRR